MKPKWSPPIFEVFDKLIPRLLIYRAIMYAFLVPPHQRTSLKTTEHSWTKAILSRGSRRKLFNPGLMNKLIRMEGVSDRAPPDCLLSSWMLHNIHEQKWGSLRHSTMKK